MNAAAAAAAPPFEHLGRLTDHRGLFEHALHSAPRVEHGYCVDDVARGLVVVCREPGQTFNVRRLGRLYLDFTLAAVSDDGAVHNRMGTDGSWTDRPGLGDWWGRALWGLGIAAVHAPPSMRDRALRGFHLAARRRSPDARALAFAALGAGELLLHLPADTAARALLADAVQAIGPLGSDPAWPWPEPRLRYANGAVVEAMLLAGAYLPDPSVLDTGLRLLDFLLGTQTRDEHLSVTGAGGRGPDDLAPTYDQQPIEVASLADACARAYDLTAEPRWLDGVRMSWSWFLGDNDTGVPMLDPATGAGFDGLEPLGRNLNQGAESTLAMLSTAQQARRLGMYG